MRAPQFKQAALASQLAANVTDLDFIYVASSKQKQISAPSNRGTEPGRATCWVALACSEHSVCPHGCQVLLSTTGCGKKSTPQITTSATMSKFKPRKKETLFHTEHNYMVQFITTRCCGSQGHKLLQKRQHIQTGEWISWLAGLAAIPGSGHPVSLPAGSQQALLEKAQSLFPRPSPRICCWLSTELGPGLAQAPLCSAHGWQGAKEQTWSRWHPDRSWEVLQLCCAGQVLEGWFRSGPQLSPAGWG